MPKAEAKYTIRADDKTRSGLRSAQARLASFARNAASRLAVPIAAAAAAVGLLGRNIIKAAKEMDRLSKAALDMGVSIEEAASLDLTAKLGGGNLEKLAGIMERIARATDEAAQGTAEYDEAFERLNLDAQAFSKLDIEGQYVEMAAALDRLEAREGRTARLSVQRQVAGRGAGRLLTGDVQGNYNEARRLGLLKDIKQAEEGSVALLDAITSFGAAVGARVRQSLTLQNRQIAKDINRLTDALFASEARAPDQGRFTIQSNALDRPATKLNTAATKLDQAADKMNRYQ